MFPMAVYFITGKLGSGKTLCAVGKIREYLSQGRRVATNLDLNLPNMLPRDSQATAIRLPDKPRRLDLDLLGQGCEVEDESRYGAIVLDELATWFNSRSWQDKERLPVIDWFLHARKHHWDVFFIVQDIESLDAQLTRALCEHLVTCARTDRIGIPFIGGVLDFMGFRRVLPKVHVATVYYGMSPAGLKVARWWYRAKDLYSAYDTAQKFSDQVEILGGNLVDMRAPYTILSPYHQNALALIDLLTARLKALGAKPGQAKGSAGQGGGIAGLSPRWQKALVALGLVAALALYWLPRKFAEGEPFVMSDATAAEPKAAAISKPVAVPAPVASASEPAKPPISRDDAMADLLAHAERLRLVVFGYDGENLTSLRIEAVQGELVRQISRQELIYAGYAVIPSNMGVELVKGAFRVRVPRA
jgi:hypothetical protein